MVDKQRIFTKSLLNFNKRQEDDDVSHNFVNTRYASQDNSSKTPPPIDIAAP